MKTTEVSKSVVGRKCVGIVFGELVQGVITGIEETECSVVVCFDHEPISWGGDIYTHSSNWARKQDEFGSLRYMTLAE